MVAGREGLRIFHLAEQLADAIWNEVLTWKPFPRNTFGGELVRAADSIGANISEGHGRYHYREEIVFDFYSRGSLQETRYWLRRAHARGVMSPEVFARLLGLLDELAPQLNAYIGTLKTKSASTASRQRMRKSDSPN